MKRILILLCVALGAFAMNASADERGYTEGQVTQIASIQITPGHLDDYVAYLHNEWKPQQEALKKAGLIVDYAVYTTTGRSPNDPDMYLAVTFANMGALDNFDEKSDPVSAKLAGGHAKEEKGVADRNSYRKILGTELIREIKIK